MSEHAEIRSLQEEFNAVKTTLKMSLKELSENIETNNEYLRKIIMVSGLYDKLLEIKDNLELRGVEVDL